MKIVLFPIAYFLVSAAASAQAGYPAFGNIDKSDLQSMQCDIDKDAVAFKLLDYGEVNYIGSNNQFKIETQRRIRIKILKEKGLSLANVKIRYYGLNSYEIISDIAGETYNVDNTGNISITKVDKASIFRKSINNYYSELVFSLPNVKVGSVIEFKFTDTKEGFSVFNEWYFQDVIPTRLSIYHITVPSFFKYFKQVYAYQNVETVHENVSERMLMTTGAANYDAEEQTYTLKNVPALNSEPYMGAAKDYLQRVAFQLSEIDYPNGRVDAVTSTWQKVTQNLLDDDNFGTQIRKNIPHTAALDDSLHSVTGVYKKMALIYRYVQQNMTWDGSEGILSNGGIKSAWDKKSGSNADINLILLNLLKTEGVEAFPLLVSTKTNGIVNTVYPFLEQFNNVMVAVVAGDKQFILNAADKYNPPDLIPHDVMNNEAFVVDKTRGGWITLSGEDHKYKSAVVLSAEITDDGLMKGQTKVYNYAYGKNIRLKKWKEEKTAFMNYFTNSFPGLKVDEMTVTNDDIDTLPMEQNFSFSLPAKKAGEYEYFPINLFQGLDDNPFTAEERHTNVDFGYEQSYTLVGKVYIPPGYEFDQLPKDVALIMPDTSIVLSRSMQSDSSSIDFTVTVDFLKPVYAVADYPFLKEFYKKMFDVLNEQVVIKKKKALP